MGTPVSPEPGRANTCGSSMDLLPDEAIPALEGAISSLIDLRKPISLVWDDFRANLEGVGIEPPLRSAFHRWAVKIIAGDLTAVHLCQSNGELGPRSSRLLVRVMLVQADHLQRIVRDLRRSARAIAAAIPIDGRPA